MENCVFCKVVAGELPSTKVYEDDTVLAFLDIHPKGPGHTMLIPKQHYRWFEEMPDDTSDQLFRTAKKIAKEMKQTTGADHVQLGIVGKDVPHVHMHLIPRQRGERAVGLA
jgi:histidine triad (HIT) family protein